MEEGDFTKPCLDLITAESTLGTRARVTPMVLPCRETELHTEAHGSFQNTEPGKKKTTHAFIRGCVDKVWSAQAMGY